MEHTTQSSAPVRRRRRRRPRKPPYRSLLILAAIIFFTGFLMGFLLRGCVASGSEDTGESLPPETTTTPIETTEPVETTQPAETTEPPQTTQPSTIEDWMLVLVNPWNPIPENLEIELVEIPNDRKIDVRCYDDLMAMVQAMKDEGLSPIFRSGYRTMRDQEILFENKVNKYLDQGYSKEEAKKEAATTVAIPGTSEHQIGLAVDIVDDSYWGLDEKQENTPVQKWLMANSWKYGFILRYPNGTTDITGIIYEPWHYRYVGKEAAAEIYEMGITLEEYLQNR